MSEQEHGRPEEKGLPPGLDKDRDGIPDKEQEAPDDDDNNGEEPENDHEGGPPEGKGWRREDHPGQGRGAEKKEADA